MIVIANVAGYIVLINHSLADTRFCYILVISIIIR